MQYSIINLSEAKENSDFRIDAEFYKLDYIRYNNLLNKKTIRKFNSILDVKFGTTPNGADFSSSEIPFIRSQNFSMGFLDNNIVYINKENHLKQINSKIILKDILIAAVGATIGQIGINLNLEEANTNQNVARIRPKDKNILNEFIFIFLRSKFGQFQLARLNTGNAQAYLNTINISNLIILILSQHFQQSIADLVNTSYSLRQSADDLYQEAENILLEELGLKDYKPQNKKCFIKNLSDTQKAGRFDAEYFQPKYEDVIEKIKEYKGGYKILEYFINNYSTGYPYKSEEYQNSGIPVIRIANIGKNKLELENNPTFISEKYSNISTKDIAKAGNILISMSGTIGNVAEIPENIRKCCINQRVLSFESKNINNKYLVLFLNSFFGYIQFEQIGVGGLQINLSYNDIKNLLIPILPPSIQSSISAKVQESFANRDKSKQLLEVAKRGVEIAIEENEESGLKYIERNK